MEAFYKEVFGGLMQQPQMYLARAEEKLKYYERTYTVTEAVENGRKLAICAMADALAYFTAVQNGAGGAVASATIGSVSVSYAGAASAVDLSPKGQAKELYRCASQYLEIYRGVG